MAPIELHVRSFTPGFENLSASVDEKSMETVDSLLEALYPDKSSTAGPSPKLFFHGQLLDGEASPALQGVKSGCNLVAVPRRSLLPSQPAESSPVPDKATIDALTAAEAKARGLPEEAPQSNVHQPRYRSVEAQIMGMLQGVDASFGGGLLTGGFQVGGEEEEEEEDEDAEPTVVEVPEPDPQGLLNLQEMGFSAGAARRALLLNRNSPENAVEWVLSHGADPDLEAPLTPEELQQAWRPRRRRRHQRGVADPELVQRLADMGFDRERSSSALIRVHNNVEHACQMLLAEDTLREAAGGGGGGNTATTASGGADGDGGRATTTSQDAQPPGESSSDTSGLERPSGGRAEGGSGMEASASSSSEYTTDDDAGGDAHMLGASSDEGVDQMMGVADVMTDDSGSDLDEYDMDDSDSASDMNEGGRDMQMPPAAEDDYEVGLQDLPDGGGAGGPPHSVSMGLSFGPDGEPFHAMVGLQDLISSHNDEEIIQEIQNSPMMIDAVQSLLAGGGAPLAHLSEHPEMATLVRRLRRIVGIETDGDEVADLATLPATAQPERASASSGSMQMLSQALVALASHANVPPTAGPAVAGGAGGAVPGAAAVGGGGPVPRRLSSVSRARSLRADLADAVAALPPAATSEAVASQPASADTTAGPSANGGASQEGPAAGPGSLSQ